MKDLNVYLEKYGIKELNDLQKESLLQFQKSNELMILAPTGSGKTLAFLLPILTILDKNNKSTQAVIIVPSRELAIQIEQVFKKLGTGLKISCLYGGHSAKTEKNNLVESPTVIVGTPGRIKDHLENKFILTEDIRTLVLDEFDKSLELGFSNDMSFIIDQFYNLEKKILTSATQGESIPDFVKLKNPRVVNFLDDQVESKLQVKVVKANENDKLDALIRLLCITGHENTLVFCNHREAVDRISDLLFDHYIGHDVFHGGLDQDKRERALIKFRNGTHKILVTTDLASRGLDIPEIKHVVHYQLPHDKNAYVHRNGRTARMHAEGISYLILAEDEYVPPFIEEVPETIQLPDKYTVPEASDWETLYIDKGKKEKISKMDIVGFLIQKGELKKDEIGKIEVLDKCSFIAVKRVLVKKLLAKISKEKIKKISAKIEVAR